MDDILELLNSDLIAEILFWEDLNVLASLGNGDPAAVAEAQRILCINLAIVPSDRQVRLIHRNQRRGYDVWRIRPG